MSPEELLLPKTVQDALYYLLSEGWDNQTDVIVSYIDSQARQIKALKDGWIAERAAGICPIKDFTEGLADQIEIAQRQLAAEHPDLFQEGL